MSSPPDPDRHPSPPTVPRDRQIDDDSDRPPSPADVNRRDEDDTDADKPLLADSRAARALHERPPRDPPNPACTTSPCHPAAAFDPVFIAHRSTLLHRTAVGSSPPPQPRSTMPALESLHDLFIQELRDLFDAENQLIKALPLMAKAARNEQLREAIELHLRETKEQVRRLETLFQALGTSPEGKKCKAMKGLIAEAKECIQEDADPDVLDASLIVAQQKVEHYEIAGYGSVRTFARVLNYQDAARVLEQTLEEEAATDEKLTQLAQKLNAKAEAADEAPASTSG
jgi:ferritin-like metal-binding protein YciE